MEFTRFLESVKVAEDDGAPANNVSNVAGLGVGPQGEPPGPKGKIDYLFRRQVPKTGNEEIVEADEFVLAWNAATAKHGKEARPIPSTFKRFAKISTKKAPAGFKGHCYANSLDNYKKRGLKMVAGFAMPESDVQKLLKTGEVSWNKLYRGYEHAWNLDKEGAVVDSTYRDEAKDYRYYGVVVPDPTAASFRNDGDVVNYVHDLNSAFDANRSKDYEKYRVKEPNRPKAIQHPVPKYDEQLHEKGYEFHEVSHSGKDGNLSYLYINKKNAGKLYFSWNSKTKDTSNVSLITRGQYGENPSKKWSDLNSFLSGTPGRSDRFRR